MTQLSLTFCHNNNLFSNYYLENYLDKSPEWNKRDHIAVFDKIKDVYSRESGFIESYSEKQLEEHFFKYIFTILGFTYEVTPKTRSREFPDYSLFTDLETRDDANKSKDTVSSFTNAIAIGEVKRWNIDLDKIGKIGSSHSEQPSRQIWHYLSVTEPEWGILSNGRLWRLYCKNRRYDNYFEIDLTSIIASNNTEAFRFFYYFFRKDAFVSSKDGAAFLDRVLIGSIDYATDIGSSLKENMYWAMKRIAEGYIERTSNHLDKNNPVTLVCIQKNTMILLYRFLFLLYAEGKELLDITDKRYLNYYSFRHITRDIASRQDGGIDQKYDSIKTSIQLDLKTLFDLINQGSDAFPILKEGGQKTRIPAYNGGLFDPNKHPDLEEWEIGDQYLADAIDLLSRSKLRDGHRDFVDYSTLEIRHLGSIYEGLLEYKLRLAESDLVVSGDEWVPLDVYNASRKQKKDFSEFSEYDRVKAGHLYLATDKGERKSTGSYYTPDYIVNYIVKNTIEPVVERKWKDAQEKNTSYVGAILSIKVLDPAMGSGHFLVGAVDFLSQKLMEAMLKDSEAGRIMDAGSYTNDWARREIVSHCIYGVDLNELAVELAKVGLWLTTISRDKPLSFLDHRLKHGNSLVGAKISDLAWYHEGEGTPISKTGQQAIVPPVFVKKILEKISLIEQTSEENRGDIKKKERIFNELQNIPEYQSVMQIADLNTSFYFGNKIENTKNRLAASFYYDLIGSMYTLDSQWWKRSQSSWFTNAIEMGKEKSFFHWELEYPEIFFDTGKLSENPGWDAVIGNPPWEKISAKSSEKHFLDTKFQSIREGEINFYNLFLSHCYDLAKKEGQIGQIVPNTWLINKYSNLLREFILVHYKIKNLHYLCKGVFTDAPDTIPVILNFVKQRQTEDQLQDIEISIQVVNDELLGQPSFLSEPIWEDFANQHVWFDRLLHQMSVFDTKKNQSFCKSVESNSILLNDLGHASDGIYKSTVEKFKKMRQELVTDYPVIESADQIRRYEINWGGAYIPKDLWSKHQILHTGEKIVLHAARKPKLKRRLVAAITNDLIFFSNRFIIIKITNTDYSSHYIFSLINSNVMNYYFRVRFPITDIDGYMLHQLPIRRISFTTPAKRLTSLVNEAKTIYQLYIQNRDLQTPLAFVEARLVAQPEESDVVHDLLAFLAEQMVEMNKTKNTEIKTFLTFVENEIETSVDMLSNKTLIHEYYANDFSKFVDVLVNNKSKIKEGYNPKSRAHYDTLKDWYDNSVAILKPLMDNIDATDDLIEQIVYKLYGLTKEEIEIVKKVVT